MDVGMLRRLASACLRLQACNGFSIHQQHCDELNYVLGQKGNYDPKGKATTGLKIEI